MNLIKASLLVQYTLLRGELITLERQRDEYLELGYGTDASTSVREDVVRRDIEYIEDYVPSHDGKLDQTYVQAMHDDEVVWLLGQLMTQRIASRIRCV